MAPSNITSQPPNSKFTAKMQDRQARNKDPISGAPLDILSPDEEDSPSSSSKKPPKVVGFADDSYESGQQRRWAAAMLTSSELLMLHAISRADSVPATRLHFFKVLCGYDSPPKASEKRAAAAKREREKEKPLSEINYRPVTGPFEL